MGRSNSVFNKRSQDRVTSSVKTQPTKYVTQQASAQSAPNPTINRSVLTRQDPWDRASQFAHNIGRGASDTARSYTTDIAGSLSGTLEERKMRDQTLSDVFITGAMEGRLDDSWGEIGRRVTQEPGRVVGEAAVEAGFLIGTMGIGAAAKGVKIGATGVKMIRAADKAKGAVGFQRKTGIIKKGKEIKFIGDKTTQTQKWSNKKGWTTKINKTKWTDRIERRAMPLGERLGKTIGTAKYASPMIHGGSGGARYLDDLKIRGGFTSTKKSLGEGFQVGSDSSVDPRYFDDTPVSQVINQGESFSYGGRFPGVSPEMSVVRKHATFEKDGIITKATTQSELNDLKKNLSKDDIDSIMYDYPKNSINDESVSSLITGTERRVNNNDIFPGGNLGVFSLSKDDVINRSSDVIYKAKAEGKSAQSTIADRDAMLNFYTNEAMKQDTRKSNVFKLNREMKVNEFDRVVSESEEGVNMSMYGAQSPKPPVERLGTFAGDIDTSSVGQITSRTGRFRSTSFTASGAAEKGGESQKILNAYNPNAGIDLPYDLKITPGKTYFTFSGSPDGIKPMLRNIPGTKKPEILSVEDKFSAKFYGSNTGQDWRTLNMGSTGSSKRTSFVDTLTNQMMKKDKVDTTNSGVKNVYKDIASRRTEDSYNIKDINVWLKQTKTSKESALDIKLRKEEGIPYDAESVITGRLSNPSPDTFRVRNKLTSFKKEFNRKSLKGKGEKRLDKNDPLGESPDKAPTNIEFLAARSVARKEGLSAFEINAVKRTVGSSTSELANIMKGFGMDITPRGKRPKLDIPARPPGNTNQNNPWFGGSGVLNEAERTAMLRKNIAARKKALAGSPKPKPRKRSIRNAPADTFQFPPQFFKIKGNFNNLDNDFSY